MKLVKPSDMSKEERQSIVDEIGNALNRTSDLENTSSVFTDDEIFMFQIANQLLGYTYEKVAKRLKVKI